MIVCLCNRVSDRDIDRAVRNGCASFEDLQRQTGVGTGCGSCLACTRDRFEQQCAGSPQASPPPLRPPSTCASRPAAAASPP